MTSADQDRRPKFFAETLGLHPWRERLRQTQIALRGEEDVPATRFGLSSLRMLSPRLALPLWLGRSIRPRRAVLTNLFNHRQTPVAEGWSVKKTQVRDWRGRGLTYDSHNGTDFAIPIGSKVITAAAGVVVAVQSEYNRGGLKIFIDHGQGLMTCYAHLARSLVQVGDQVARGAPIAISGYSGLDALVSFPFGIPHVHFNVWLNCDPVDPFGHAGQASLWRTGALPEPCPPGAEPELPAASTYDEHQVSEAIAGCITASTRARLSSYAGLDERAARTIIEMNYYPTRFPRRVNLYGQVFPRSNRLDMPFSAAEFDGVVFADELRAGV